MVRNLIVLVVLAVVAIIAYDSSRKITESHVRNHYQAQLEAFRAVDEESICDGTADDYSMAVVEMVDGRSQETTLDGYTACENSKKMIRLAQVMSEQTRGLATLDVAYSIQSIDIASDGRSAEVESIGTVKIGDMLVARTKSKETLSRAFWKVRSHGGKSQVWSYRGE